MAVARFVPVGHAAGGLLPQLTKCIDVKVITWTPPPSFFWEWFNHVFVCFVVFKTPLEWQFAEDWSFSPSRPSVNIPSRLSLWLQPPHLRLAAFPHTVLCLCVICLYILCLRMYVCFSFPLLHIPFHPLIYRVGIVAEFRNGPWGGEANAPSTQLDIVTLLK